jgi:hypothetical protein
VRVATLARPHVFLPEPVALFAQALLVAVLVKQAATALFAGSAMIVEGGRSGRLAYRQARNRRLAPGGQSDAEEESFHGFILWV